jgi:3-oxoacyl-[acyl-carrier protein] reductase
LSSGPTGPSLPPRADKVAIVTGAATGIGKGIAARLGADGAVVVVNHLAPQVQEADAVDVRAERGSELSIAREKAAALGTLRP